MELVGYLGQKCYDWAGGWFGKRKEHKRARTMQMGEIGS